MAAKPREVSEFSYWFGWFAVAMVAAIDIGCLVIGEVVWGRRVKTTYTRAHDPEVFWFTVIFFTLILILFLKDQLETVPKPYIPREPDRTPRDWTGKPLK